MEPLKPNYNSNIPTNPPSNVTSTAFKDTATKTHQVQFNKSVKAQPKGSFTSSNLINTDHAKKSLPSETSLLKMLLSIQNHVRAFFITTMSKIKSLANNFSSKKVLGKTKEEPIEKGPQEKLAQLTTMKTIWQSQLNFAKRLHTKYSEEGVKSKIKYYSGKINSYEKQIASLDTKISELQKSKDELAPKEKRNDAILRRNTLLGEIQNTERLRDANKTGDLVARFENDIIKYKAQIADLNKEISESSKDEPHSVEIDDKANQKIMEELYSVENVTVNPEKVGDLKAGIKDLQDQLKTLEETNARLEKYLKNEGLGPQEKEVLKKSYDELSKKIENMKSEISKLTGEK